MPFIEHPCDPNEPRESSEGHYNKLLQRSGCSVQCTCVGDISTVQRLELKLLPAVNGSSVSKIGSEKHKNMTTATPASSNFGVLK